MTLEYPKVSIFTPSHDPTYLHEVHKSILDQDYKGEWEWVLVLNGNARDPGPLSKAFSDDERIKVHNVTLPIGRGVGYLKREAVSRCTGEILVELDHDDLLHPSCLSEVHRAFKGHPDAGLVYSQFAQMNDDCTPNLEKFGAAYGWRYKKDNCGYLVPELMPPTPHNVSLIWYAPNHVRAFTREAYDKTNGYNPDLMVLDDQDLMCQLYQVGEFVPIDKLLYYQRIHGKNTQKDAEINARIQEQTWDLYKKYFLDNAKAWAERNDLAVVNARDAVRNTIAPCGLITAEEYDLRPVTGLTKDIERIWLVLDPNGILSVDVYEDTWLNEHLFRAFCGSDDAIFQESVIYTYLDGGRKRVRADLIALHEGYVREGGLLHNTAYPDTVGT